MSTADMTLTNSYWEMLRNLSNDVKLRLASLLTTSVLENNQETGDRAIDQTSQMVPHFSGALIDKGEHTEWVKSMAQYRKLEPIDDKQAILQSIDERYK